MNFRKRSLSALLLLSLSVSFSTGRAFAYEAPKPEGAGTSDQVPKEMEGVGVNEKLNHKLNLQNEFTDDKGQTVTLAKYYDVKKPVFMTMIYYNCPSLCNYHLNGLLDVFKKMNLRAGKDFTLVAVSMDHKETPDLAAKKKANYIKELGQPGAADGWHFLVGSETNVKNLAADLGFEFKWNEAGKQFAHAAVAYVTTPAGIISRYLYGIEFSPQTLHLSLVEASQGKIGNIIDQVKLFCFQFDPSKNKYTLYAYNIMQMGGAITALLLAVFLVPYWVRERRRTSVVVKGEME
jgi:protein SCO1